MSGARFRDRVKLTFSPNLMWSEIVKRAVPMVHDLREKRIAEGRFPAQYDRRIGQRGDVPEETVQPGELIVYSARLLGLAVAAALKGLHERSPVGERRDKRWALRYRDSFEVSLRGRGGWGRPIPMASFDPAKVTPDIRDAVVFSPRPFSRKLDVQLIGTRPLKVSAKANFFLSVARGIATRFPLYDARRLYTIPPGVPFTFETDENGRKINYPCIIIENRGRLAP